MKRKNTSSAACAQPRYHGLFAQQHHTEQNAVALFGQSAKVSPLLPIAEELVVVVAAEPNAEYTLLTLLQAASLPGSTDHMANASMAHNAG